MDSNELKRSMMKLWKDTFHDCDEYIDIVFDEYYSPEYVEYEEVDGRLVAALLSVPYDFRMNICGREHANKFGCVAGSAAYDENDDAYGCVGKSQTNTAGCYAEDCAYERLRGLYLCGLATRPEYRGNGIMGRLIEKINIKAIDRGFDFTFLIPASDGLRKYYRDRGYVDASFRNITKYSPVHNFLDDYNNCLDVCCGDVCDRRVNIAHNSNEYIYDCSSIIVTVSLRRYFDCLCNVLLRLAELYSETISICSSDICSVALMHIAEILMCIERNSILHSDCISILHTRNDYEGILRDKFLYNGDVFICINNIDCINIEVRSENDFFYSVNSIIYNQLGHSDNIYDILERVLKMVCVDVLGSAFVVLADDCNSICVSRINISTDCLRYVFLDSIKKRYPGKSIVCYDKLQSETRPMVGQRGAGSKIEAMPRSVHSYGMMRLLNPCKILEYVAKGMPGLEFSILVDSGEKQCLGMEGDYGGDVLCRLRDCVAFSKKKSNNDVSVTYDYRGVQWGGKMKTPYFLLYSGSKRAYEASFAVVSDSSGRRVDLRLQGTGEAEGRVRNEEIVLLNNCKFLGDDSVFIIVKYGDVSVYRLCDCKEFQSESFSDSYCEILPKTNAHILMVSESQLADILFGRFDNNGSVDIHLPVPKIEFDIALLLD